MMLAILIIAAAVCSSIFRALTPWAKQYKPEVEHHLSALLGQPVHIGSMETGWYWFAPVLKLKQVSINEEHGQALRLSHLLVGINLFKSLWQWHIQPGVLYVDTIHLVLREKEGVWHVDGLSSPAIEDAPMTAEGTQKILVWLAQQEQLVIKHLSAHIHFQNGGLLPISGFNLTIINHGGQYSLKGGALLEQTNTTSFHLVGNVYFNPYHFEKTKGQLYFLAKNILPAQWQSLFPNLSEPIDGGKGNLALWVDLDQGALSAVQAQVQLKRLAWHLFDKTKSQLIQNLSANLLWKPSDLGWQLQADKINLRIGGVKWPENQMVVDYDKTQQSHRFFIKSILLESVLSQAIPWPKAIQTLNQYKPQGVLDDTQLLLKDNQLNYLLTRFHALSWQAQQGMPQVSNLSGALHWQPEEGRLELDSQETTIALQNYPTQQFNLLNVAIEWKELSDGLRVSLERFVANLPNLALSAEGVFSNVSSSSLGHIRFDADFSAKNIETWFPYIPKHYLKPGLELWLKNNMKHIATTSGKVKINGLAKDFPFDNPGEGDFSLNAHANGGELVIDPTWPRLKDLEGYITLNHRNLDIDLVHGDFGGVPLKKANLRVDAIGKDKETLLIRGLLESFAQKGLDFIKKSPLKNALSALSNVSMDGLLSLNLQLEIPLYPENKNVLMEGDLDFNQNSLEFKNKLGQLGLEEFSGRIHFNEKGVAPSHLTTTVFGNPWTIDIKSVLEEKQPYTQVLFNGECTVESLQKGLHWPLSSFLKGHFSINSELKLTRNPDAFNRFTLNTNLSGLKVNLPPPLGKRFEEKKALEVVLDFKDNKEIRLNASYNGLIGSNFLFQTSENNYSLQSGQISLGNTHALPQQEAGVSVVGQLDDFPVNEWQHFLSMFMEEGSPVDWLSHLRIIDVSFNKLTLLQQQWNDMAIKAKILPNQHWSFNVKQQNISGDFTYHPPTNALSGHIQQLRLMPFTKKEGLNDSSSSVHPKQIPNLNLRIDNLLFDNKQVGNVTLKSQSSKKRWQLKYCRIESPFYRFFILGDWEQTDTKNRTQFQVKGQVVDLAKSLEHWQITPAVSAKNGEMSFVGGWNGGLFDFSVGSLNGKLQLQLKNGIITHLSQETEEKLGLGKLLSILSLQTLPRRLQLDFSDLSHEGFSFDVFKGTFAIRRGIMSTQDSYLDGPVAYAAMKGELNLVKRLYDLDLQISPHITASLPIVATIAGGPIAGVATWVASKIISQSMQKISSYSYKISGPWSQPIVQQLNIVKQKVN